jgi:class 3 adenylate cyclase
VKISPGNNQSSLPNDPYRPTKVGFGEPAPVLEKQTIVGPQQSSAFLGGTIRCAVVDVDMVGYSDVARLLEENTHAGTVGELNRQIQSFITSALNELSSPAESRILGFTGDGGILLFVHADDAHSFSCLLQSAAKQYSAQRNIESAKRRFRVGIATGEVNLSDGGSHGDQYAGVAIANAGRLQMSAAPGEILIDKSTFSELSPSLQQHYAPVEEVRGKRDEIFHAQRCSMHAEPVTTPTEQMLKGSAKSARAMQAKGAVLIAAAFALCIIAVFIVSSHTMVGGRTGTAIPTPVKTDMAPRQNLDGNPSQSPAPVPNGQPVDPKSASSKATSHKATATSANTNNVHGQLPASDADTRPPDPSEFDSQSLVGTWEIASGDKGAAEVTLLELHADGTYKKTLSANVKNFDGTSNSYGTTHNGRWRSRGSIVYLSGDGNSPEYLQDLTKARRLN